MLYLFEWDPAKAQTNATKHGVTFEQATKHEIAQYQG